MTLTTMAPRIQPGTAAAHTIEQVTAAVAVVGEETIRASMIATHDTPTEPEIAAAVDLQMIVDITAEIARGEVAEEAERVGRQEIHGASVGAHLTKRRKLTMITEGVATVASVASPEPTNGKIASQPITCANRATLAPALRLVVARGHGMTPPSAALIKVSANPKN